MSRGLGEVQIQALRGFLYKGAVSENWHSLRGLKHHTWGDRRNAAIFPSFGLCGVRKVGDEVKWNHHSSFKRALKLLEKSGYLEHSNFDPATLFFGQYYRLTEKGKCAVSKLNTYANGAL